jgi:hypothetical protein
VGGTGHSFIQNQKESENACSVYRSASGHPSGGEKKYDGKNHGAVDDAYHIGDTLIFLREYPAELVAMDGRLQSENPRILEALKKISAGA